MENTGKVFFENDSAQWYIAAYEQSQIQAGTKYVGPMTAADVYQKVLRQEVPWTHYIWRPGLPGWQRISDVETFKAIVPQLPPELSAESSDDARAEAPTATSVIKRANTSSKKLVKTAAVKSAPPQFKEAERSWFLHFNDSQYGPFSKDEVDGFLRIGKIHGKVHAWRDGMENWDRLENIELFTQAAKQAQKAAPPAKREQRAAPRRPIVAKILMANDRDVAVGVCRDVSIGGLQVLTDKIPGPVGSKIKMNVSSSGNEGQSKISPFAAEGVIVRILEDGRGFSFRFEQLSDSAKRAIERFIDSAG